MSVSQWEVMLVDNVRRSVKVGPPAARTDLRGDRVVRMEFPDSPHALTVFWEEDTLPGSMVEICIAPKEFRLPIPEDEHILVYDQIAAAVVERLALRNALLDVTSENSPVTLPQPVGSLGRLTIARTGPSSVVKIQITVEEPYLNLSVRVPLADLVNLLNLDHGG